MKVKNSKLKRAKHNSKLKANRSGLTALKRLLGVHHQPTNHPVFGPCAHFSASNILQMEAYLLHLDTVLVRRCHLALASRGPNPDTFGHRDSWRTDGFGCRVKRHTKIQA